MEAVEVVGLRRAPKNPKENAAYRRALIEATRGNAELQEECWIRASRDPVWYCDTWGYTFNPMDHPLCPDRPFILYDFQESLLHNVIEAMEYRGLGRTDRLVEKSRKMGATWVIELGAEFMWHFRGGQSILFGSNKEDNVDMFGNPASLFGKLDYFLDKLPGWLRPRFERVKLLLTNVDNGSIIKGESTNDNFARSGRFGMIFMDEFAAVENGLKLLAATQAASRTRIVCSTHQGSQTAFNELREKMHRETPDRVLRIHWTAHPEYSRGLYTSEKDQAGRYVVRVVDESYPWERSSSGAIVYPFVLDGKVRSPWYDEEERSAPNEQIIGQELDINPATSGSPLMHPDKLTAVIRRSAKAPLKIGDLSYDDSGKNPRFSEIGNGRLRLWCPLDKHDMPPESKYAVTCDIGMGTGGDRSSNSVAVVSDVATCTKVAEFCWFDILPQDFGVYAVALCRWFHNAELAWEAPGPGAQFSKAIRQLEYQYLHRFWSSDTDVNRTRTEKKGAWHPSKDAKRNLLENYAYALHNGLYENPSREALAEVAEYERQSDKTIVHVKSVKSVNPDVAGEAHGDRVIADALAVLVIDASPRARDDEKLMLDPPENTAAWRQKHNRATLRNVSGYGVRRRR